jgi:exodeoxyribonuclease VII large subunit
MSDFDLIDDPAPGQNAPEFTVSELSGAIKRTLEGEFGRVRVRGEVGRVMRPRSGHLYFDLKDDKNVINCTTWKGQVAGLGVQPEEGLEVVVEGRLSTYGPQSRYNINVDRVAVAGVGALMALLEKRRAALQAEGLFAPERKKPIPFLPEVIGVVTSPSGAVIRDILHRLRDRCPRKVLIWPVAVQGDRCAPEVANAIRGFNALQPGGALPRPDLIIVARGGGSVEDLWGFNEEAVVRAAADSTIPLISAVGHETDTTLIDHAADRRAPTPTAAAEIAVPVRLELLSSLGSAEDRMLSGLTRAVSQRKQRLADLGRALPRKADLLAVPSQRLDASSDRLPAALIAAANKKRVALTQHAGALRPRLLTGQVDAGRERVQTAINRAAESLLRRLARDRDELRKLSSRLTPDAVARARTQSATRLAPAVERLANAGRAQLRETTARLDAAARVLESAGPRATLARGYAIVRDETGQVLTRQADAAKASALELEFADGHVTARPDRATSPTRKKPTSRPTKPDAPDQGTLF